MKTGLYYVYILRSESEPPHFYTGFTESLDARLARHNSGANPHMPAKRHYFPVSIYLSPYISPYISPNIRSSYPQTSLMLPGDK